MYDYYEIDDKSDMRKNILITHRRYQEKNCEKKKLITCLSTNSMSLDILPVINTNAAKWGRKKEKKNNKW